MQTDWKRDIGSTRNVEGLASGDEAFSVYKRKENAKESNHGVILALMA
jgi:hypothetical protein